MAGLGRLLVIKDRWMKFDQRTSGYKEGREPNYAAVYFFWWAGTGIYVP
jgi:hypothetical protein